MNDIVQISVQSEPSAAALKMLSDRVEDMSPIMREIGGIMHDAVEENFAREGRPHWAPLAKRTEKARERKGYWPGRILQMRGELAASITTATGPDFAAVGTNKVYAGIHQFGGTIHVRARSGSLKLRTNRAGDLRRGSTGGAVFANKRHRLVTARSYSVAAYDVEIPARPFLHLEDEDRSEIYNVVKRDLAKAMRNAIQ